MSSRDPDPPYPLFVIGCEQDGFVCTVWEKPGTGCAYFRHCPYCGGRNVEVTRVESLDQHQNEKERLNVNALREE